MVLIKDNVSYQLSDVTKIIIKNGEVLLYSSYFGTKCITKLNIPNDFLAVPLVRLHKAIWTLILSDNLLHSEEDFWFNLELLGLLEGKE